MVFYVTIAILASKPYLRPNYTQGVISVRKSYAKPLQGMICHATFIIANYILRVLWL